MKIITIGDLHGRDVWKKFADIPLLLKDKTITPRYDYYVFIGDYCDSFDISYVEILYNLRELIQFKKDFPKQVILLWGNHELHYGLVPPGQMRNRFICSGYESLYHWDFYPVLRDNYDLFQVAFEIDNYLFTHAGIHKGWYDYRFTKEAKHISEDLPISLRLAQAFEERLSCMFDIGYLRGGHHQIGGPLWLDKRHGDKPILGYHQIVGHTATSDIITQTKRKNTSMTFIDVLHLRDAFYTINYGNT